MDDLELESMVAAEPEETSGADESQLGALPDGEAAAGDGASSADGEAAAPVATEPTTAELSKQLTELQDRVGRSTTAFDRVMAEKQRADSYNQTLAQQNQALSERLKSLEQRLTQTSDKEFVARLNERLQEGTLDAEGLISIIDERSKMHAQGIAEPIIDKRISEVESQYQADRMTERGQAAFKAVREHATGTLKISDQELSEFLYEPDNLDASGKPFGWTSPENAAKQCIERLNGRYYARLAKAIPAAAAKAGSEAAAKRLVAAGPSQSASVQGKSGGGLSPSDEFMTILKETKL